MDIRVLTQPERPLGDEISVLLDSGQEYTRIVFVSAFVGLRTVLRMRERLLARAANGCRLCFTVGIDLGGTSREVLEELLRWDCETFIFHNTIQRATFHPKIYLFEGVSSVTLILGSNNLTDGGFYTNYEAATRYDFSIPSDVLEYDRIRIPLDPFLSPHGLTVRPLDTELLRLLIERGELLSEVDARRERLKRLRSPLSGQALIPTSPFGAVDVPRAPLLPRALREEEPVLPQTEEPERGEPHVSPRPEMRLLVWRKSLPQSDALQVNEGSHHVGGVRLTQARFEDSQGQRIDQTTYFRRLFADHYWEREHGRHSDQEHTFIPMRVFIRGTDYGIRNFEISHKPSGEAGQDNYTTILRWGREFVPIVVRENLTNTVFSLYETPEDQAPFFVDIDDR